MTLLRQDFAGGDGEPVPGVRAAWERQKMSLGYWPVWTRGEPPSQLTFRSGWLPSPNPPVVVYALAIGIVLALIRRDRQGIVGGALAGTALLTGVVAGSQVTGIPFFYLTRWAMAIGWFAAVMALWLILGSLIAWRPKARPFVMAPAFAALAVMAVLFTSNVVHDRNPAAPWGPVAHELAVEVQEGLPPGDGPVQFLANIDYDAMAHRSALIVALERKGIETSVQNANPMVHGKWRTGVAEDPRVTLVVVSDKQIAGYAARPDARLVAEVRPQTPAERREAERFREEVGDRLDAGEFPDWSDLDRAAYLRDIQHVAVFEIDPKGS
jgi:hypothetical protein